MLGLSPFHTKGLNMMIVIIEMCGNMIHNNVVYVGHYIMSIACNVY